MIATTELPPDTANAGGPARARMAPDARGQPVTEAPAFLVSDPWPTELDARTPKPPTASVAILAAVAAMPAGRAQYVRTGSQPEQLLRELSARGLTCSTVQLPDGSWRMLVQDLDLSRA